MKKLPLHIILALLAAMLLTGGCHRHDAFFQSVEDLMVTAPDSALALAEAFEPFGRAEKARRALLIAKAKNKAYIDIADDSLIESAVDYYRGHNDSLEVQALYYSAARFSTLSEYDKSLAYLITAEAIAEDIHDFFYLAMTQRLAADCLNELYVMDRAEEYAIKAHKNFLAAGKENHAKWCQLIVATALSNNHHSDSAITVLSKTYDDSSSDYTAEWHNVMGQVQYLAGNYNDVITHFEILKKDGQLECGNYIKLSDCYISTNNLTQAIENLDSATRYCQTWNDSIYINIIKSKIYEKQGDIKEAFALYKKSDLNLYKQYDRLLTHPYYNVIDNNLKEEKKQYFEQYKTEKTEKYYIITIALLSALVAIAVIIIIKRENIAKNNSIRLLISHAGELNAELSRLSEIEKKTNIEVETILSEHIRLLNNLCSEWYLLPENKKNDKVFGVKIDSILSEINSEATLAQFEKLVNKYQNNIIDRICRACPKLTDKNKRIIIYLAIGLSYDSICFLLSKSKSNFAVARHRLKKMIENSEIENKEHIISTLFFTSPTN